MKIVAQPVQIPVTLINDGEIIYDNLKEENLTEEWLLEELRKQNYTVGDIFHAEYERGKDLQVYPIHNRNHEKWDV